MSKGPKAPKSTTQTTDLPVWAQPYAKDVLAKGAALTDISQNPYQTYGGERIAAPSALQQQSYARAGGMGVAPQIGYASNLAAQAGNYAPATFANQFQYTKGDYKPGEFENRFQYEGGEYVPTEFENQYQKQGQDWNAAAAEEYMSPFKQAALEPQIRAATRDAQLAQMQDEAAAIGRGAYGGSATAIGRAMREQGLLQNVGDIRAKGYQTAYEQAAQQFQQDQARKVQEAQLQAQYGLSADQAREQSRQFGSAQGLNVAQLQAQYGLSADQAREASRQFGTTTGVNVAGLRAQYGAEAARAAEQSRQFGSTQQLNAAQQLGVLGGQQFQQGLDINKLQNVYGQQQQAQIQAQKDVEYQQFLDQQNYPYKQLGFMSDLVRGMPLGQTSTTSMYGGSGSPLTTLGGLGALGKGVGLYKKGGAIKSKKASGLGVLAMHKIAKG